MEERSPELKGKRPGAPTTEHARMVLTPLANGVFTLKPRIICLDESGSLKSHESEPVEVNVTG